MEAWKSALRFVKNILGTVTIRDRRGTDDNKEDQAKRVGHDVALPSFYLFVRIKSFFTTHFGGCNTLAVNDGNTWFWITIGATAHLTAQDGVDMLPGAIISPDSIIIPDMIPGREVFGKHAPLTAGSNSIEDCIQDFTNVDRAFLARSFLLCNKGCNTLEFLVIQITCVPFARIWSGGRSVMAARHRGHLRSSSSAHAFVRSAGSIRGYHVSCRRAG